MDKRTLSKIAAIETTSLNETRHSLIARLSAGERIRGCYRLWRARQNTRFDGAPYWHLQLADRSGLLNAFIWPEMDIESSDLPLGAVVEAEFTTRQLDGLVADIRYIDAVESWPWSEAIDLLPRAACPVPSALDRLAALMNELSAAPLYEFVCRVVADDTIGLPLLTAPASLGAHHGWAGGLLEHAVDVAQRVAEWPNLERGIREIAIVAAILHDIGKTKAFATGPRLTALGRLVRHESLTLELCSSPLRQLDQVWPEAGCLVRHLWTAGLAAPRGTAVHPLVEIVAVADRLSASESSRALAFASASSMASFAWRDGRMHWRMGGGGDASKA